MEPRVAEAVLRHHLRIFGLAVAEPTSGPEAADVTIRVRPGEAEVERVRSCCEAGGNFVAVLPDAEFCRAFGVERDLTLPGPQHFAAPGSRRRGPLRSLHPAQTWTAEGAVTAVLLDTDGRPVWVWLPVKAGGVLLIGTDLAADLVRYRQGDPARAVVRAGAARWGFDSERPNYLFEAQIEGEPTDARFADEWAELLACTIAERHRLPRRSMLPGGAPGAVVITGDDDQAFLEKYDEQLKLLGRHPMTYFMHPLTRHTAASARRMFAGREVELGLHPDALEAPGRYSTLLREQTTWFRATFGTAPAALRNHGFLNDGYWGHLPAWLEQGFRLSSNLPGLDGRVLNGSLLPARVATSDALTAHWSLLTLFGDGMIYALGLSGEQAAARILDAGRRIRETGIPGVVVLNLHPQNVGDTVALHVAALQLVDQGFICWTASACLAWFEGLDRGAGREPGGVAARARSFWRRLRGARP